MTTLIKPICAVTGGSGFLGSYLIRFIEARGYRIRRLQRNFEVNDSIPFHLGMKVDASSFKDVTTLVHCAYDFSPASWEQIYQINVVGSQQLFTAAKNAGVKKIIFISSISAFEDCQSLYGKAKLLIEDEVLKSGGIVLRPGLIYGDQTQGMYGRLWKISKLPILPVFSGGRQPLYLIHVNDLIMVIEYFIKIENDFPIEAIPVAHLEAVLFKDILLQFAKKRNRKGLFFSIPCRVVLLLLRIAESLRISLPFRSDNLLGLIQWNKKINFELLNKYDFKLRSFRFDDPIREK